MLIGCVPISIFPFYRTSVKIKNNNNNACNKNKNLNLGGSGGSNSLTNFSKGTLIELSTGELKRVEDMRTEDFITSSSKNPNLQLIDTTVVKMTPQSKNNVLITLSYNNSKVIITKLLPFISLQQLRV